MLAKLREQFAIPLAKAIVHEVVAACDTCKRVKVKYGGGRSRSPSPAVTIASKQFNELVAVDLLDMKVASAGMRYVLVAQDQCSGKLVTEALTSKRSSEVRDAFDKAWVHPLGIPAKVKSDQGTEFEAEFANYLKLAGIEHMLTPVHRPQANGMVERKNLDIATALKALRIERGMPESAWAKLLQEATFRLNQRPKANGDQCADGRTFSGYHGSLPATRALEALVCTEFKDAAKPTEFALGELLLFRHPNRTFGKLEVAFKPARVVRVLGPLVYEVEEEGGNRSIAHLTDLRHNAQPLTPAAAPRAADARDTVAAPERAAPAAAPVRAAAEAKSAADFVEGELVMWREREPLRRLFIGSVQAADVDADLLDVHVYNTYDIGRVPWARRFLPSWQNSTDSVKVFARTKPRARGSTRYEPELCPVNLADVVTSGFRLDKGGRIPAEVRGVAEHEAQGAHGYVLAATIGDFVDAASPEFDNSEDCAVSGWMLANHTTHQPVKYDRLGAEERALLDAARAAEDRKFVDHGVYVSVPRADLPKGTRCIPMQRVETSKLTADGTRKMKCRLVAMGHLDQRTGLDTSSGACPQDSIRFALLIAMSMPDYDPERVLQVDVENAYLQAPCRSKERVYLLPPKGHPDAESGLAWLLKRAVYGLPDAGRDFEAHLHEKLRDLG
jgi:transposase InsO family protein